MIAATFTFDVSYWISVLSANAWLAFPPLPGAAWLAIVVACRSQMDASWHHAWSVYRLASAAATLTAKLEATYACMRNGAGPSGSLLHGLGPMDLHALYL